jgi:hypothetical protein
MPIHTSQDVFEQLAWTALNELHSHIAQRTTHRQLGAHQLPLSILRQAQEERAGVRVSV